MSYNANLQANNADLQAILDTVNALPNAGSGGSSDLAKQIIERTITEIDDDSIDQIGHYIFAYCKSLKSVNLPNATYLGGYSFVQCSALESAKLPNVTEASTYNFYQCAGLLDVELPLLTAVNNSAFRHSFQTANDNTRLYIPSATTLGTRCMSECYQLRELTAPLVTTIGEYCFSECYCLRKIGMPNLTAVPNAAFQHCTGITHEDFLCLTSIAAGGFSNCSSLETLILRTDAVVSLANVNAFTNTPIAKGTGYVYVPSALIESYKSATNWTTYASQFRAIEDYPDICGG